MKTKQIIGSAIAILTLFLFGFAQVNGAVINKNGGKTENKDVPKKFIGSIKPDLKAENGIIVEFKNATSQTKLVVKDLNGRKVLTHKFNSTESTKELINLNGLKVGIYNITLISGDDTATGVYTVINN